MYAPTRTLARDERIVATPTADFDMEEAVTPTLARRIRWALQRRVGRTLSATGGWRLAARLWDRVWARERNVELRGVNPNDDGALWGRAGCPTVAEAEESVAWARESVQRSQADGYMLADAEAALELAEADLEESLHFSELERRVAEQELTWSRRGARERVKDRVAVWLATAERSAY